MTKLSSRIGVRVWSGPTGGPVTPEEIARFGFSYVDNGMVTHGRHVMEEVKSRNADHAIFLYVIGTSLMPHHNEPPYELRRKLMARFNLNGDWEPENRSEPWHDFRLKDTNKQPIPWEGGPNWIGNIGGPSTWGGSTYAEHYANWAVEEVWRPVQHLAAGIYWDTNIARVDWLAWDQNKDIDGDGHAEDASRQNELWGQGLRRQSIAARNAIGQEGILITNSPQWEYAWYDGRHLEYWPSSNEPQIDDAWMGEQGSVEGNLKLYLEWCQKHFYGAGGGPWSVIDVFGSEYDYKKMRSGLAAALLGDGKFMYGDTYPQGVNSAYWYDEYALDLGDPVESAYRYDSGVYRRSYTGGMVLLNANKSGRVTLNVDNGYRHPEGTQDPEHNNGAAAVSVTLDPGEGVILLKS